MDKNYEKRYINMIASILEKNSERVAKKVKECDTIADINTFRSSLNHQEKEDFKDAISKIKTKIGVKIFLYKMCSCFNNGCKSNLQELNKVKEEIMKI